MSLGIERVNGGKIMQVTETKTKKPTQDDIIRKRINQLLDDGLTDKKRIIDMVEKETKYPRPTIRRSVKKLRDQLKAHLEILSVDVENHRDGWKHVF